MYRSEYLDILLITGFGQGAFLCFVLWQRKHCNPKAVKYLVALIGLVTILLLGRATFQPEYVKKFAEIIMLPDVILFLVGPLVYFFLLALLKLPYTFKIPPYVHYIPAFFHVIVVNTTLGLNLSGTWDFVSESEMLLCFRLIETSAIISISTYLYLSYCAFLKYLERERETAIPPSLARFLKHSFYLAMGLIACWLAAYVCRHFLNTISYIYYIFVWFFLCTILYYMAYRVWNHPELLQLEDTSKRSKLSIEDGIVQNLQRFMQEKKPYLDQELKIGNLAESLHIPKHELSSIINEGLGKNFFDFINSYRIAEFIQLRNEDDSNQFNILELAYEAGFNSKSAFNRAFRKETGKSPTVYFQLAESGK